MPARKPKTEPEEIVSTVDELEPVGLEAPAITVTYDGPHRRVTVVIGPGEAVELDRGETVEVSQAAAVKLAALPDFAVSGVIATTEPDELDELTDSDKVDA